MNDDDERTRITARDDPADDGTQLVRRRSRSTPAPAAVVEQQAETPVDDATQLVRRAAPTPPSAATVDDTVDPDDATQLVRRAAPAPAPVADPPADTPDDATQLVRRAPAAPVAEPLETAPAPDVDDATQLVRRAPTPAADAPAPDADDSTRIVSRDTAPAPAPAPEDAAAPEERTLLRRRAPAPADETRLTRRERAARPGTAPREDVPADDATRLTKRPVAVERDRRTRSTDADAPDDGTALSPRGRTATAAATYAPAADVDTAPAIERYAIRAPRVAAALPLSTAPAPEAAVGDGGLTARLARRRALRTRLTIVGAASAVVFAGSLVGLIALIAV